MTPVQIDCFLAAVRSGSFAGAAKELFISVQGVSQHVQSLESEFSIRLFERQRGGVRLTEQGRDFLGFASRWIGLYNSTMRSIQEQYDNMSGCLRIALSEYIDSLGRITQGISGFAREHSEADIRCIQYSNRDILRILAEGESDVVIMCDNQVMLGGDYEIERLAPEDLRLYLSHCPPLPPGTKPGDRALTEVLMSVPMLDTPYGPWSTEEWREISRRMSSRLNLPPTPHRTMSGFHSVVASLRTVPCAAVCDAAFGYLRDGDGLQSIPLDTGFHICCIWEKRNENPLVRAFSRYMRECYSG